MDSGKDWFNRQRRQGRGGKLKLNKNEVRGIRKKIKAGIQHRAIAMQYNISKSTVSAIGTGQMRGRVK